MLVIGKVGRETSQITAHVNTKGSPVHAHQEVLCEFLVFINTDLILPPQASSLPSPHLHFLPCLLLPSRRWSLFPKPPYRAQTGFKLKSPCSSCGAVVRRMPHHTLILSYWAVQKMRESWERKSVTPNPDPCCFPFQCVELFPHYSAHT